MGKIVRYEYVGGFLGMIYTVLTAVTLIFIPLTIIHLVNNIIRIEEEMDSPNEFMEAFRKGHIPRD